MKLVILFEFRKKMIRKLMKKKIDGIFLVRISLFPNYLVTQPIYKLAKVKIVFALELFRGFWF